MTRLEEGPAFPSHRGPFLSRLASPSTEIADVAELIVSDATLSGRVLQHANSASFSFPSQIEAVDHAIALIGMVLHAVGAFASGALRTDQMRSCWQHSIATAIIAEACGVFTSTTFTAGIIHDIGRLGLLAAYPKEYKQLISASVEQCLDILDFKRERFGVHQRQSPTLSK